MTNKPSASAPPSAAPFDDDIPDTGAYKALGHPDRLRMLGLLRFDGPATASGLARRLGLNSGATSYHLRQLAAHGLIEEAEGLGNKRDRWWQARRAAAEEDPVETGGDAPEAVMAMIRGIFDQHKAMMNRALREFPLLPDEWKKTSNVSDYTMSLTPDEAEALKEKLMALLWEEVRRAPAESPQSSPGKRNYTVMLHAFPFADPPGGSGSENG